MMENNINQVSIFDKLGDPTIEGYFRRDIWINRRTFQLWRLWILKPWKFNSIRHRISKEWIKGFIKGAKIQFNKESGGENTPDYKFWTWEFPKSQTKCVSGDQGYGYGYYCAQQRIHITSIGWKSYYEQKSRILEWEQKAPVRKFYYNQWSKNSY